MVTGGGAAKYAPDFFAVHLAVYPPGKNVPLGDVADLTLEANKPVTIYDLPYHAECTLSEGDNGQTSRRKRPPRSCSATSPTSRPRC